MRRALAAGAIAVGACAPAAEVPDPPIPMTEEIDPFPLPERSQPRELELEPEAEPLPVRDEVLAVLTELGRRDEYACVDVIFSGESSWRPDVIGDDGDSFGLGQRNAPAHGAPPWPWPVREQVIWFTEYADDRYGGWCPAAERWQERADARGGAGWW